MSGRVYPNKKEILVNTFLANDLNYIKLDSSSTKNYARKIIDRNRSFNINSLKNIKNDFYNEMLIVLRIMQALGALTISRSKNGKLFAGYLTIPFIYSIIIYTVLSVFWYLVLIERIKWFAARDSNFDDMVIYFNTTIFMASHFLPILTFIERKKIATYLNSWNKFQAEYYKVTRNVLIIKMRRNQMILVALLAILTILIMYFTINVTTENRYAFMSQLKYPYLIIVAYYAWLMTIMCVFWYFNMAAVQQTANQLLQDCKGSKWSFVNNIEEYRALWVNLKNICCESGEACSLTYMYYYIYTFLMILTGLYALASQNSEMHEVNLYMRIFFAAIIFSYMSLIANSAHKASAKVGDNFKKELFLFISNEKNEIIKKKLQWFAHNVSIDPPLISLNGYVVLNRGFNVSMYASLLTYLVVVLQFRLSGNDRTC